MVSRVMAICLFVVAPYLVFAQDPAPAPAPGAAPKAADGKPADAAAAPAEPAKDEGPRGDVVTLKNGHIYKGLQVTRATAAEVVLYVADGVEIKIPRRQVVSIEYDDIDPALEKERAKKAETAGSTLLSGQKVSPELQGKLKTDVSNPELAFDKADISEVVAELNKRVDNTIEVDKLVLDMPADARQWTLKSTPGMQLSAVLQDELSKAFPKFALVIRNNKFLITTVDAAKLIVTAETTKGDAPATPTPPSPSENGMKAKPANPAEPPKKP